MNNRALSSLGAPGRLILALMTAGLIAGLLSAAQPSETAASPAPPIWRPLIERLATDGFDRQELEALFSRPELAYTAKPLRGKLRGLYRKHFGHHRIMRIQKALAKQGYSPGKADGAFGPKTARAIEAFQKNQGMEADGQPSKALEEALETTSGTTITPKKWSSSSYDAARHPLWLAEALEFAILHQPSFTDMQNRYLVPAAIAGGIITVETRQGTFLGAAPAIVPLSSMALGSDFSIVEPMFKGISLDEHQKAWVENLAKERADWAYAELVALLHLARKLDRDPLSFTGSPLGAIGIAQFMPSNVEKYGADGDGDGLVDLFTPADAIHSVGSYLRSYGWSPGVKTLDQKRQALWGYNHSQRYVNSVLAVAGHLQGILDDPNKDSPPPAVSVRVENATELVGALKPEAQIILAPGEYVFEEGVLPKSAYIRWINGAPVVFGLKGLRLSAQGRAVFSSPAATGSTFSFFQCPGLRLEGIEFRAAQALPQAKTRNQELTLVELMQCPDTAMRFCLLTGPAGKGLRALDCPDLRLSLCMIQHCTSGALILKECPSARLQSSVIRRCEGGAVLLAENSPAMLWQRPFLHHNASLGAPMLLLQDSSLRWESAVLERNSFTGLAEPETALDKGTAYTSGNKLRK